MVRTGGNLIGFAPTFGIHTQTLTSRLMKRHLLSLPVYITSLFDEVQADYG